MKTIKATRATKDVQLGEIRRVDDKTAFNMVGNSWMYISKSEWKNLNKIQDSTDSEPSQKKVKNK
jgi:hypothetical protein